MGSLTPTVDSVAANLQQATQDVLSLLQKPLDPRDRARLLRVSREFNTILEGDMVALRIIFFGVRLFIV